MASKVGDKRSDITRLSLLRAAERLFASRGVDNVSMREIAVAAGQRNHAAAEYHFGDKRELIEALLHRHSGPVDEGFVPALDRLRHEGRESIESIITVLVTPMVAILGDDDGGVDYLFICAELTNSPSFPITSLRAANGPGATELSMRLMQQMGELDPALLPFRMVRTASVLFGSIASYQRLTSAGLFLSREAFRLDLIASLTALLQPPSAGSLTTPRQSDPGTKVI